MALDIPKKKNLLALSIEYMLRALRSGAKKPGAA